MGKEIKLPKEIEYLQILENIKKAEQEYFRQGGPPQLREFFEWQRNKKCKK